MQLQKYFPKFSKEFTIAFEAHDFLLTLNMTAKCQPKFTIAVTITWRCCTSDFDENL